jgi:hypothetical protein
MRRVYQKAETVIIRFDEVTKKFSKESERIKVFLEILLKDSEQAGYFNNMNKNSDTVLGI